MTLESDLDWSSVKFVFYDTGSNAKNNLCILLKFIEQRFVCFILFYFDYNIQALSMTSLIIVFPNKSNNCIFYLVKDV